MSLRLRHSQISLLLAGSVVFWTGCSKDAEELDDHGHRDAGADTSLSHDVGNVAVDLGTSSDQGTGFDADAGPDVVVPTTDQPFNESVFRSTHNSYTGGPRGSIRAQLDSGVRFIELDIHSDDFETEGYRVGHDAPDDEVDHESNPSSASLEAWLSEVQTWRTENPEHIPITLGIDLKDPLSSLPSAGAGNLGALNELMLRTFGDDLFRESDVGASWPTIDEMRGRVLVVLSGSATSRLDYRRTIGTNPSVAGTPAGTIVAAVENQGTTRMWAGDAAGMRAFESLDGRQPAVALDGSQLLLVVAADAGLSFRTAELGEDGAFTWNHDLTPIADTADATDPSVRFQTGIPMIVYEPVAGPARHFEGTADGNGGWTWAFVEANRPRFDETVDGEVSISTRTAGPYSNLVELDIVGDRQRLRLAQHMFSEMQYSGPDEFEDDGVFFYAVSTLGVADAQWALAKRAAGLMVRFWQFNLPNVTPIPGPNFPATDRPESDFYRDYCDLAGCFGP